MKSLARFLAIDTETTGPNLHRGDRAYAVSTCDKALGTRFWECPVDPFSRSPRWASKDIQSIVTYLRRYTAFVFHNADFDLLALGNMGIRFVHRDEKTNPIHYPLVDVTVYNIPYLHIHDTLPASHVLDSAGSHKLKDLAERYFDIPKDDQKELQSHIVSARDKGRKLDWNLHPEVPADGWVPKAINPKDCTLETYAIQDAKRTSCLWSLFEFALGKENLWPAYFLNMRVLSCVSKMEANGVSVRPEILRSKIKEFQARTDDAEKSALLNAGMDLNLRSTRQLGLLLFSREGFGLKPVKMTASHAPSTDVDALEMMLEILEAKPAHGLKQKDSRAKKFLTSILSLRKTNTAIGYLTSYLERMVPCLRYSKRSILHPSFNATGTKTTRFSSSNPNAQNIGKGKEDSDTKELDFVLREVFGPSQNRFWFSIDYQQLQLRIFAAVSGEDSMMQAFREGWDAHDFVACRLFKTTTPTKHQRRIAKNINFGIIFGAGERKIDSTAGMPGAYAQFLQLFPNAHDYMQSVIQEARRERRIVTPGGYPIPIEKERAYAGVNYIVQGCEGEIVKDAMYRVDQYLEKSRDYDTFMTLQVHDELVFDAPKSLLGKRPMLQKIIGDIRKCMMDASRAFGVETDVNVELHTTSWDVGTKVKFTSDGVPVLS